MNINAVGTAFVLFYPLVAFAGIFGPSNFEECVLDKMKGQSPNMISLARAACKKAFPDRPVETIIDHDRIKYEWCGSGSGSQAVCIEKKPGNLKITKVEGIFFEDACDKTQTKAGIVATAEEPLFGTTYKFDIPPGNKKCAVFTFYGFEK